MFYVMPSSLGTYWIYSNCIYQCQTKYMMCLPQSYSSEKEPNTFWKVAKVISHSKMRCQHLNDVSAVQWRYSNMKFYEKKRYNTLLSDIYAWILIRCTGLLIIDVLILITWRIAKPNDYKDVHCWYKILQYTPIIYMFVFPNEKQFFFIS